MVLDDEEDGLRRVTGAQWHADRTAVNAGWALETQLASSHTDRQTHHVLSMRNPDGDASGHESEAGDGAPHYDLFDTFKPENNKHRTFKSNPGPGLDLNPGDGCAHVRGKIAHSDAILLGLGLRFE